MRPMDYQEFWEQYPLRMAFADVYERLEHPPTGDTEHLSDHIQANAVSEAANKDYIRYLRNWASDELNPIPDNS